MSTSWFDLQPPPLLPRDPKLSSKVLKISADDVLNAINNRSNPILECAIRKFGEAGYYDFRRQVTDGRNVWILGKKSGPYLKRFYDFIHSGKIHKAVFTRPTFVLIPTRWTPADMSQHPCIGNVDLPYEPLDFAAA